jgi:uncharacterized protein (DUF983 family)
LDALEPVGTGCAWKCPVCTEGTILGRRDPQTAQLLAADYCIYCGQKFIFDNMPPRKR